MTTPRVLIIAGSDSGGGAGIQADIKTVTMLGGHPMTAVTAITAQNSLGVTGVHPIPTDMVIAQMDAVLSDLGVDAVKIGMIGSAQTAEAVADRLAALDVPIVFDPVMVATSGSVLADDATIAAFRRLMAIATVITPNVLELEVLAGRPVRTDEEVSRAGGELAREHQTYVLAKGGHLPGEPVIDRLFDMDARERHTSGRRVETPHSHGTGCTLASAIACLLGRKVAIGDAVDQAQAFVRSAMLAAPGFGAGNGPMGHGDAADGRLNLNQITLPTRDYDEAVAFYRTLGLTQIVDSPGNGYARFECPGGATLSIHASAQPVVGDAVIYFEHGTLDAWLHSLEQAGVRLDQPAQDESHGWREARLTDPTGNKLCLYRAADMRRFPPWRVS